MDRPNLDRTPSGGDTEQGLPAASRPLVIFDCDGVLVDSEPLAAQVFAEALGELGMDAEASDVDAKFRGRSLRDCIDQVRQELGRPLPGDFEAQLVARTREAFEGRLESVPDVAQALDFLKERMIAICVASSGGPDKIEHSLRHTGLADYFTDETGEARLFSASQVPRGKPHPDLFLFAAAQMGQNPGDCIVVEDSRAGVQGGVSAGMRVLGFACEGEGSDHARALEALGATPFYRMSDLPALLKETLGELGAAC